MNMLSANIKTMTSREIAELTGKRHDNVIQLARKLKACQTLSPEFQETEFRGRMLPIAIFDKRDSLVLVARLSPEFTAAVIDRWQELEGRQHQIPKTFAQALQLAADQQLQIENLATKIKGDAPKVVFADKWMNSTEAHSLTQAAKLIGVPPKYLIEMMAKDKIIFKRCENSGWEPYQRRIDQGVMILKPVEHGDNTFKQAKVTGKGLIFLNKRYGEEL